MFCRFHAGKKRKIRHAGFIRFPKDVIMCKIT